ncbi:hypothetical protein HK100_001765 [Physocladia obscura]|uniref:EB1 C-terminal domain-containing protein n=1 Tax=Physocladia obscura TaxID=109957 RepID=A0AAD5SZE1_9FUNG|nr:hypothetical protein HK100_001765 [Physocladia obscura]
MSDLEVKKEIGSIEREKATDGKHLHRKLETRHLQMIALGGTIGTGLFVSSGATIAVAGPLGVLLAYAIVGILVYAVVVGLAEVAAQVPVSGAFGELTARFVDESLGFALGWNYYFLWLLCIPAELSALGVIPQYWLPDTPAWIFTLIALVLLLALNLLGVKAYGEVEYWLSLIKVAAIVIFIIIGIAIVCGANHTLGAIGFSNWSSSNVPGAPIVSITAVLSVFTNAFYSYSGTELIGVTAGEAKNPRVSIPRAIKGTFWRILLFYIISLLLIGMIIPMTDPLLANTDIRTSPFTRVLEYAGFSAGADFMNVIILISIFSAANGSVYSSSRTLQALAANKMAPEILVRTTKRGVPISSMIITAFVGGIALIGAYVGNGKVFNFLVNILSISALFCWILTILTHLGFRKAWIRQGRTLRELVFKAPFYPYFDYLGLFIGAFVFVYFIYQAATTPFDFINDAPYIAGVPLFVLPIFLHKGYQYYTNGKFTFGVDAATVDLDSNVNGGVYTESQDEELQFEHSETLMPDDSYVTVFAALSEGRIAIVKVPSNITVRKLKQIIENESQSEKAVLEKAVVTRGSKRLADDTKISEIEGSDMGILKLSIIEKPIVSTTRDAKSIRSCQICFKPTTSSCTSCGKLACLACSEKDLESGEEVRMRKVTFAEDATGVTIECPPCARAKKHDGERIAEMVNDLCQVNYTKIEQCGTGAVHCAIMDSIYRDVEFFVLFFRSSLFRSVDKKISRQVPLSKVRFNAKQEYEYVANFKVLQACFDKHKVDIAIPVERLMKCKFQDNLEFMQFVKRHWDTYYPGGAYDALTRRGTSASGHAPPQKTVTSKTSAPQLKKSAAAASSAPGRNSIAAAALGTAGPDVHKRLQEMTQQSEEMKLAVGQVEKERDFYFSKLREIELYVSEQIEDPTTENKEAWAEIQNIMYKTEEGFEPPTEVADAEIF